MFKTRIRVRTYECDSYGHVNNATFLNYCEVARVDLLEKMGYDLTSLKQAGFLLVIVKIEIEYIKPAYANDELEVTVDWIERGKTSATFEQEIYHLGKNELIARARIIWVATDLTGKPIAIPDLLLDSYQKTFGGLTSIKTI